MGRLRERRVLEHSCASWPLSEVDRGIAAVWLNRPLILKLVEPAESEPRICHACDGGMKL